MTLKSMQLQGYTDSEAEYKAFEKLILDQYREANKQIDQKLQALFAKMPNLKPEDQYNWLIQYDRNIKLKKEISAIYTKYDLKAQGLTADSGAVAMANNYYRQFFSLQWTAPISFSVLPDNLIEYAVTGQREAWKKLTATQKDKYLSSGIWPSSATLTELFASNRKAAILAIQRQINAGMMAGDGYAKIAARVKDVIGRVSKDGTTKGQFAKALRIVRTEGNRLLNEGAYSSTLEGVSQGIKITRMWDASLDGRTRPAHGRADGQKVAYDKPFTVAGDKLMYPGDSAGKVGNIVNCRGTTVDLVDDWMPEARRGFNPVTGKNDVFDYKDFNQWAEDNNLTRNKYGQLYKEK